MKSELADCAIDLVAALDEIARERRAAGAGRRSSGFALSVGGIADLYARRYVRGGLARFFLHDLYFGTHPRPWRELAVACEARRRGAPVAEPMGAMVDWVAPLLYRGFMLTRRLAGMTLWEFMTHDEDAVVRWHVLEQARHAIETMHGLGVFHADLNMENLFVARRGESLTVVILDLDKARLYRTAVGAAQRRVNLARLARSVRKVDPAAKYINARALQLLTDR